MRAREDDRRSEGWGLAAGVLLGAVAVGAWATAWRAPPYSFAGRTVVITGGSRGLGLVLAREFGREGAQVALLARDEDELQRAAAELEERGIAVLPVRCDVREREEIATAVARIHEHFGRIDVLVNNAGVIQVGPYENLARADFENAMAVHFFGVLDLIQAVLPHLRQVDGGRIVNIASIGGKIAVPHLLPYSASKFALVGLSNGLRSELRREGICVTTICPGLMRTGSPRNAIFKGQHRREYAWFALADAQPGLSMHARRAARRILEACRDGKADVVLGVPAKAAVLFHALFPETTARLLAAGHRALPNASDEDGREARRGHESESGWTRSALTRLSREAARQNNE